MRRRGLDQCGAFLAAHQLAKLLNCQPPLAHFHERADDRTDHLIEEAIRSHADRQQIAALRDGQS